MAKAVRRSSRAGMIAAGIGAAIAAAAAIYFFTGKRGKKNRAQVKAWAVKVKKETLAQLKKMKTINRARYDEVVEKAVKRYRALKEVTPGEAAALAKELKSHWKKIERHVGKSTKTEKAVRT